MVHRFVGFGLDGEADFAVMRQHPIKSLDQQFDAAAAILGFPEVSAFPSEPENQQVGPEAIAISMQRKERSIA